MILSSIENKVKVIGRIFEHKLSKGDCLLSILFNVAVEKVIWQVEINGGSLVYYKKTQMASVHR